MARRDGRNRLSQRAVNSSRNYSVSAPSVLQSFFWRPHWGRQFTSSRCTVAAYSVGDSIQRKRLHSCCILLVTVFRVNGYTVAAFCWWRCLEKTATQSLHSVGDGTFEKTATQSLHSVGDGTLRKRLHSRCIRFVTVLTEIATRSLHSGSVHVYRRSGTSSGDAIPCRLTGLCAWQAERSSRCSQRCPCVSRAPSASRSVFLSALREWAATSARSHQLLLSSIRVICLPVIFNHSTVTCLWHSV